MKKIVAFFVVLLCTVAMTACSSGGNKASKLYFDDTGIAYTQNIIFTKESSLDLKDYIKLGDKKNSYGEKVGVTTYDDLKYTINEYDTNICSVDANGVVTRKNIGNATIYVKLKNDIDPDANRGPNWIEIIFGNDKTFGTYIGENSYRGSSPGEAATMTLVVNSDLTYTLTVTAGKWHYSSQYELEDRTITGKIKVNSNGTYMSIDNTSKSIKFSNQRPSSGIGSGNVITTFYPDPNLENGSFSVRFICTE